MHSIGAKKATKTKAKAKAKKPAKKRKVVAMHSIGRAATGRDS